MKTKLARICLFFAAFFFVGSVMMLCYCPGGYVLAAILAIVSVCTGTPFVRVISSIMVVAAVIGGIMAYQGEQRRQQHRREIEDRVRRQSWLPNKTLEPTRSSSFDLPLRLSFFASHQPRGSAFIR